MDFREGDVVWCSRIWSDDFDRYVGYHGVATVIENSYPTDEVAVSCLSDAACNESPDHPYYRGEVIYLRPSRMTRLKRGNDGV